MVIWSYENMIFWVCAYMLLYLHSNIWLHYQIIISVRDFDKMCLSLFYYYNNHHMLRSLHHNLFWYRINILQHCHREILRCITLFSPHIITSSSHMICADCTSIWLDGYRIIWLCFILWSYHIIISLYKPHILWDHSVIILVSYYIIFVHDYVIILSYFYIHILQYYILLWFILHYSYMVTSLYRYVII